MVHNIILVVLGTGSKHDKLLAISRIYLGFQNRRSAIGLVHNIGLVLTEPNNVFLRIWSSNWS